MSSERHEKFHPETVWPTPEKAGECEWHLRYDEDFGDTMTREDKLFLASVCNAYVHLRMFPESDWKQKVEARDILLKDLLPFVKEEGGIVGMAEKIEAVLAGGWK